jgi:aminopeptidase
MDSRVTKLARLLINYSLRLQKGELLLIRGEIVTLPLILAAYEEALHVGANPYIDIVVPDAVEAMFKLGSKAQLEFISPVKKYETDKIDAYLHLWGSQNLNFLAGVDPKRQAITSRARASMMKRWFKRTADGSLKWVGTQYPTQADAQKAEMSLADYEDFVYRAGNLHLTDPVKHWRKIEKEQLRLVRILNRIDRLHIQSATTDLKLQVKGRKWISCHGTENFPDGEIFTSPIENSANGFIQFTYPSTYVGREVTGARLEFKAGRVVSETATRNLDYLKAMLNTDAGARRVGEIAIGTNYQIKRSTGNTLFDEKIGGSCHLAVGASIPESGGKNHSGIHWDMVCDLKRGGEITADGKVIYRNGKFIV